MLLRRVQSFEPLTTSGHTTNPCLYSPSRFPGPQDRGCLHLRLPI